MNTTLSANQQSLITTRSTGYAISVATDKDREEIYRIRHEIYARELRQHQLNDAARLVDRLDARNVYLVVRAGEQLAGFISITPPSAEAYSIDKYFARETLPFAMDDSVHEIRLLTVLQSHRGSEVAMLLMYGAFRWVEAHGGQRVVAIGRREVVDLYLKAGLRRVGASTQSGAVTYDLLQATIGEIRAATDRFSGLLTRLEEKTRWNLNFSYRKPATCFHGGTFFKAIGERFDTLERKDTIINADVLDAWFPPSPKVLDALQQHLGWLARTSPPTACSGLVEAIAEARGVSPANILPGAGSSDLIFRAFRQWLTRDSHALILDPTYGEYSHILEEVIGCTVDRLSLRADEDFDLNLDRLKNALLEDYDLVVIVNPNSPTGRHVEREKLAAVLRSAPEKTRIWIDETYMEYVGREESLETFAARSENVVVCKSMSKVYALSGMRAAYLCAGPHQLESLRAITPPWVVGLPTQVAAVAALGDPEYYAARYAETHMLREELAAELRKLGWRVLPGRASFLLCELPENGMSTAEFVAACQQQGLFLRNPASMGSDLGARAIRVAVKDAATNRRMIEIIRRVS
jgi:histidinol-phosphate/aromatic aminotransferase/cobyric acid decarboxylase-like protein